MILNVGDTHSYYGLCGAEILYSFYSTTATNCNIYVSGYTGKQTGCIRYDVRRSGATSGTTGNIDRGRRKFINAQMPCVIKLWSSDGLPFYLKIRVVAVNRDIRPFRETRDEAASKLQTAEDRRQKLSRLEHVMQKRKEYKKEIYDIRKELCEYFKIQ